MKPCKQLKNFGAKFYGFTLPKYALFGNVSGTFYVCLNLYPRKKDGYYNIRVWDDQKGEYVKTTTQFYPKIRGAIKDYMKSPEFIRTKVVACEHRAAKAEREERAIQSICPREKRPQSSYDYKTYSQSRVDGKGYSLDWEYNENKPVTSGMVAEAITFKKFDDAVLDKTGMDCRGHWGNPVEIKPRELQKNSMAVTPIKVRPERKKDREITVRNITQGTTETYKEKVDNRKIISMGKNLAKIPMAERLSAMDNLELSYTCKYGLTSELREACTYECKRRGVNPVK